MASRVVCVTMLAAVSISLDFMSTRYHYHSLSANVGTTPADLTITAATEDSEVILGVRPRKYTLEAVQYHPERILSEAGDSLFRNFLALKALRQRDVKLAKVPPGTSPANLATFLAMRMASPPGVRRR